MLLSNTIKKNIVKDSVNELLRHDKQIVEWFYTSEIIQKKYAI